MTAPLNTETKPALQRIEVASFLGIPHFQIIGLPCPEVAEAKERIRAAIEGCGFEFPRRRIVLNLSPASIRKRGTGLDLAMALAVLQSSQKDKAAQMTVMAWGELGLQGQVKPAGQLTRTLYSAWQNQVNCLIVSKEDYLQALNAWHLVKNGGGFNSPGPRVYPVGNLRDAWDILQDPPSVPSEGDQPQADEGSKADPPIQLLPIPPSLERTLSIAALGHHHLLLLGPRGVGKSHAMEWLQALQAGISADLRLSHLLVSELSGGPPQSHVRRIGQQTRPAALLGHAYASAIQPGEFSMAHGGLLIADELPEWPRDARESLREPLERGKVTLTRAQGLGTVELPARFVLAANGNLCPCGGLPAEFPAPLNASRTIQKCLCTVAARTAYLKKLSGPVLDRIDVVLLILSGAKPKGNVDARLRCAELNERIREARSRAVGLWGCAPGQLAASELESLLNANPRWRDALSYLEGTSLRSRHKVVRVALSLATWDQASEPGVAHFVEAACYRPERLGLCE